MDVQDNKEEEPLLIMPGVRANKKVPQRKLDYATKLRGLLDEYDTCLVVTVTNVGSSQIAQMRKDFRGTARFLFGKNTLMRKVVRDYMKDTGRMELMPLLNLIRGNSGLCFTKGNVRDLRKEVISRKVQCPAKAGTLAPCDVFVPPGPTGMEPTQTAMFQTMNIPTRINRGQIDIVDEVHLIKEGMKVGASEAQLLVSLNIKPFYYGVKVLSIYEKGQAIDAAVLDLDDDDIANAFYVGLRNIAALCFKLNYPSITCVPHSLLNGYKKVLSLGLKLNTYTFSELETIKEILKNPNAFMAGGASGGGGGGGGAPAPEPEKEESSSSSDAAPGAGAGMFGAEEESSSEE